MGNVALNVVMLGPPGAGKGTQAGQLARERGVPKISTGDILRDAVQSGTEVGRRAKAILEAGELVSDEIMIGIVRERLAQADAQPGFVLDGFPRTVVQAIALDGLLADRDPLLIVDIAVPEEEAVRRLGARRVCGQCGANADDPQAADACARCDGVLVHRSDDSQEVIRERLKVYTRATQPLVDHYRDRPTFASVNGNQPPDAVSRDLASAIDAMTRTLGVGEGALDR